MFLRNTLPEFGQPLLPADAATLSVAAANEVERYLAFRDNHCATPLVSLPAMSRQLGVAVIQVKDEGQRLGLGSFKALGGSYAVIRLVLEAASAELGRTVDIAEVSAPAVRDVAARMTFACATDGNHGR
ncbi:MAG: pyridoxal-phosphate dependent enzyme, partial [Thermomicrobiales bacterium]|nr:pyridoxal-phosphate dependent enzyme [Thermomicrobiales bacterium]